MCESCGCPSSTAEAGEGRRHIDVVTRLLEANDRMAAHNRAAFPCPWHAGTQPDVVAGGRQDPRCSKRPSRRSSGDFRIAVIEGDLETDNDARRIRAHGVPAVQITTGNACHLDARHGPRRVARPAARPDRHLVHRECRQSRLPGELRSRPAPQRRPAFRDRRRRQAGEISCHVPRRRSRPADQERPAAVLDDFDPERAEQAVRALANAGAGHQPCRRAERSILTLARLAARASFAALLRAHQSPDLRDRRHDHHAPGNGSIGSARSACRARFKVMNVCGGHERSIAMAGLRKALPPSIELVPGPGCPVCVCPEEIIYQAIRLALVGKRHPRRLRRHAARAGQCPQRRGALARGGARRRRRRLADRVAARGCPHRPGTSPTARWFSSRPASRPRRRRSRPCWPKACLTICPCCLPDGARGRRSPCCCNRNARLRRARRARAMSRR